MSTHASAASVGYELCSGPPFGGAERRFGVLMRAYATTVSNRLRRLGVPPCVIDDASQQVFWIAARKLTEIPPSSEGAFLLATAARVAADVRRAETRRSRREVALDDDIESSFRVEEMLELKRTRCLLAAVLASLPEELAAVLTLSEAEGLTAPEISRLCRVPVGTVASRLRRARRLLKQRVRYWRSSRAHFT